MKKRILFLIVIVMSLCLAGCDDEQIYGTDGYTTLRISAKVQYSGTESRAVLSDNDEKNITDKYVFLLYKGTDRNATLELMEQMDAPSGAIKMARMSAENTYTAIMIANSNKATLETQGVTVGSTLEALYSATYAVNSTDNNPNADGSTFKITWSGIKEGINSNNVKNGIAFTLNPNVARLRVDVNNNASKTSQFSADKINLVNIQVKNVANKVRFAQNALQDAKLFTSADNGIASASDVLDYEIEAIDLSNGESATYEWYVPCNMLEPAKNTGSRAEKAPAYATYIEIDGIRRLDFMDTAYKVYPGVKNSNEDYENIPNYYVKADYKYTVNVKIDDDGLKYDVVNSTDKDNATAPKKVVFPAGSNCFMVHPKISATANGTIYEVPIDQANRFWSMKDATRVIGENDEWKAVFIWQDIPGEQVMYFCDEKGSNITKSRAFPDYASLTEYYAEGKGHEPIRFKLVDTETYGNVLIGIRKNGVSDYLWSWHLWVTDYNPDAAPTPSQARTMYNTYSANGMYVENVTGVFEMDKHPIKYINGGTSLKPTYGDAKCFGNVQHFYQYYKTKYWEGASAAIWDWDKGGMYANKWIMDRNLGAQGPCNGDIENAWDAFGLYYQFGRKDPFPYINYNAEKEKMRRKVYDINGNVINKWKDVSLSSNSKNKVIGVRLKSGGSFEESVKNPFTLYSGVETTWASASSLSDVKSEYWYGLESGKHKSIFDPCPPGWCVPVSEAFEFATVDQPAGVYSNSNSYTNVYASFSVYVHMRGWYNTSNPEYHRNFAIITSLGCINGSALPNKHLDSVFASQGYIADDGSSIYGLITLNRKDIRGCYWTARGSGVNGEMLQFKPVNYVSLTNNKYTHSSSDTENGNDFGYDITEVFYARFPRVDDPANGVLLYHRMNTPLRICNFFASCAQPVRCIQEPD